MKQESEQICEICSLLNFRVDAQAEALYEILVELKFNFEPKSYIEFDSGWWWREHGEVM